MPKNKKFDQKQKNAMCVLKLVDLKSVVFPPLVVVLVSYCIYCIEAGMASKAWLSFTLQVQAHGFISRFWQHLQIKFFDTTTVLW